jgi:hypothetical protein
VLVVVIALVVGVPAGLHLHDSSSNASTGPSILSILRTSKLSSVAWNDTYAVTQYRLYFQDENNTIVESAWDSGSRLWQISNRAVGKAKAGSPIAATVTGPPDFAFVRTSFPLPHAAGKHAKLFILRILPSIGLMMLGRLTIGILLMGSHGILATYSLRMSLHPKLVT